MGIQLFLGGAAGQQGGERGSQRVETGLPVMGSLLGIGTP